MLNLVKIKMVKLLCHLLMWVHLLSRILNIANMSFYDICKNKILMKPISLHSASSVCIPNSVNNFRDMLPTIRLSPLGSPIIRKYTKPFNAFKRRGMYPNVSKCNAKRCVCCTHLYTKTTITSSVNGRQFSIINNNDLD